MAVGMIFGLLSMAAALAIAVPASVVIWISILVLLTFCGKPRESVVVEGRRLTTEISRAMGMVVLKEGNLVAVVCAIFGYFLIVRYGGVQHERSSRGVWVVFVFAWLVCTCQRSVGLSRWLAYLDAIIQELEFCSGHISIAQLVTEPSIGDNLVFADSIIYFKSIRDFEAEKLANLNLFLEASAAHLRRRREFAIRFNAM
ncbi:hypothetical protein CTI12_AA405680 [Artemisia annua]|uniref:Uncharacterized protein n=1 Tax=Artemisia annua TaxID=35608 RepID=A0A2U1M990_ARTAN|nr:hypothetical protein CTI12_AA405680 [Artemisia annua]